MQQTQSKKRGILSRFLRWGIWWATKLAALAVIVISVLLALSTVINPRLTPYIITERLRHGPIDRQWVPIEEMSQHVIHAAIGAEDAQYCTHNGIDWSAIQNAIAHRGAYGGSSITQQTVKNVFLWHGRSYLRKALEIVITPMADVIWGKRRTLEIYLNVAEFGTGLFGIEAAAQRYFGTSANDLNLTQASALIALLPNPKGRSIKNPSRRTRAYQRKTQLNAQIVARDDMAFCVRD